ncbi:DUF3710 domain-containing protein (plasmid) [Cellulomonas sp. WB94]|uniref:DUF3710 domain-containing protein n=1 Tax=Cellulomonas sp. WB94 TaxID=2173174 RepID=UPI000D579138|nr:DUF3710 domain-containing protein [Cellulomonas sp. WB94]PVU81788.1 DUF3710 domain-containing protein [Cellulomonas sp. WB94]
MGLFRRGTHGRTAEDAGVENAVEGQDVEDAVVDDDALDAGTDDAATNGQVTEAHAAAVRTGGPWDVDDAPGAGPRVDLGAILLPAVQGMELRMEIDKATGAVSAAAVSVEGSTLQIQAFAAPRTEGIWDDIRAEIAESVIKQGGSADDLPGPFGRELLARLPVRTAEGRTGHRPARFIGADGPRWFVRGVVTGKAAVDPAAAEAIERIFSDIVVVRGAEACAPRDLLPLRIPGERPAIVPDAAEPSSPSFDPMARGPEITEIR